MQAAIRDVPEEERFTAEAGDDLAGFLQYRMRPGKLIALIHTEVAPAFEGERIGTQLAEFALSSARSRGLGVLPFCPFVKAYVEGHPEQLDLVPEDRRKGFGL